MSDLARKSNASRISRYIEAEMVLDEGCIGPWRKRKTDAGYDVAAAEAVTIRPNESAVIPVGVRVKCPSGYFYKIEPRSSITERDLVKTNPIIDATYTGPLFVKLRNVGKKIQRIEKGERIAQLIFYPQIHVNFKQLTEFPKDEEDRGDNGYGSTGK